MRNAAPVLTRWLAWSIKRTIAPDSLITALFYWDSFAVPFMYKKQEFVKEMKPFIINTITIALKRSFEIISAHKFNIECRGDFHKEPTPFYAIHPPTHQPWIYIFHCVIVKTVVKHEPRRRRIRRQRHNRHDNSPRKECGPSANKDLAWWWPRMSDQKESDDSGMEWNDCWASLA